MAAHCSQWALSTKNSQWTVFGEGWSPWRKKHDTGPFWGNRGFIRSPWRFHRHNWGHVVTGQSTPSEFSLQNSRIQTLISANVMPCRAIRAVSWDISQQGKMHWARILFNACHFYISSNKSSRYQLGQTYLTPRPCEQLLPVAHCTEGCKHRSWLTQKWRVINMTPC